VARTTRDQLLIRYVFISLFYDGLTIVGSMGRCTDEMRDIASYNKPQEAFGKTQKNAMSVQMREVLDMNKSQWYERRKTTDVVARNYYSNLSQKEERDQGTENWGEQREAGFLVCVNVMRMHERRAGYM
jgi:hypothetical protein